VVVRHKTVRLVFVLCQLVLNCHSRNHCWRIISRKIRAPIRGIGNLLVCITHTSVVRYLTGVLWKTNNVSGYTQGYWADFASVTINGVFLGTFYDYSDGFNKLDERRDKYCYRWYHWCTCLRYNDKTIWGKNVTTILSLARCPLSL